MKFIISLLNKSPSFFLKNYYFNIFISQKTNKMWQDYHIIFVAYLIFLMRFFQDTFACIHKKHKKDKKSKYLLMSLSLLQFLRHTSIEIILRIMPLEQYACIMWMHYDKPCRIIDFL